MSYGVNLHQAQAGKQSIGAVATEKVQSDSLNLGFPSAYQSVYAAKRVAPRYFPEVSDGKHGDFWRGSDLQCHIHEERRKDANYMAGAKVRATQLSRVRYVGTPHGMGIIPKPVLGQRVFANPINGALQIPSARQDQDGPFHFQTAVSNTESAHAPLQRGAEGFHIVPHHSAHLRGGVLRTMVGQKYGRQLLDARVGQLNAIQTAKQEFQTGMPTTMRAPFEATTETPFTGENAAIELNLLLQQVLDAIIGGESAGDIDHLSSFTMKDATRALALLFRMAPTMDSTELDDTFGKVDQIVNGLDGILDPKEETTLSAASREIGLTLQVLFTKLRQYLTEMVAKRDLQPKERLALSKALVNSLGFSKMLKYSGDQYNAMLSEADKKGLMNAQQYQRYRQGDMGVDGDGSSWDSDDDDFFDRPEGPREDDQHDAETGVSRSARNFTPDVRQEFGTQSGMFFPNEGRGMREYFGEAPTGDVGDVTVEPDVPLSARQIQDIPLEARPPPRESPSAAAAAAATRTAEPPLSSFWDRDTQAFNVGTVGKPKNKVNMANVNPNWTIADERARVAAANEAEGLSTTTSGAPTRSTATRSVEEIRPGTRQKHYNKLPSRLAKLNVKGGPVVASLGPKGEVKRRIQIKKMPVEAAPAPAPAAAPVIPTKQSQLPTTREGYVELSRRMVESGGPRIVVYEGSSIANIKKNFVKRLGLAGKY
jgi:hypothetical protein